MTTVGNWSCSHWGALAFIIAHASQRQPTWGLRELGCTHEFSSVTGEGLSPGLGVERILTLQDYRSGGVGFGNYRNKCRFWQLGIQKGFHWGGKGEAMWAGFLQLLLHQVIKLGGGGVAEEECPNQSLQKNEPMARNSNTDVRYHYCILTVCHQQLISRTPNSSTARAGEGGSHHSHFEDGNTEA